MQVKSEAKKRKLTISENVFASPRPQSSGNSAEAELIDALRVLGQKAIWEPHKVAISTYKSSKSHIRTLKRNLEENGIQFTAEYLKDNYESILKNLRKRNNEPASADYQRQVGMTLKRMFPGVIDLSKYDKYRKRQKKNPKSFEFQERAKLQLEHAASIVTMMMNQQLRYPSSKIGKISIEHFVDIDLGRYEACLAILLSSATSLRIDEIRQLKMEHFRYIRYEQYVPIKTKTSKSRLIIYSDYLEKIMTLIEQFRDTIKSHVGLNGATKAGMIHAKRFDDDYVLLTSTSHLQEKLKRVNDEIARSFPTPAKGGFNQYRAFTTSSLIEGGGLNAAQAMNDHKSLTTTLTFYNAISNKSATDTFKILTEAQSLKKNKNFDDPTTTFKLE